MEIEKQTALNAQEKAEEALKNFTKEQAEKDQLNFNELKGRARTILEAERCPTKLLKEMQVIADKYPKKETLSAEIKSLKAINSKCQ